MPGKPGTISREESALPADQSPRPPLSFPEQPDGKQPELPPLHFPQRPDGQGLAPAPGGYPPPPPAPQDGQAPPPGDAPQSPPGPPPDWAHRWGPQPGAPGGPGPRRPPGTARPLRPPEPAARQGGIAALILGLLSLLALLALGSNLNFHRGIYLVIFALAVGIAACWFGITAMRRARQSVTMRPRGAVAGVVLGVIGGLLSVALLVLMAADWQQLNTFSQCLHEANTPSAQQACQNQLNRSVQFGRLSG